MTDAEFLRYLRKPGLLTVLAEVDFSYEQGLAVGTGTVYLADRPYITGPTDSPANRRYRDVIERAPEFERGIDVKSLGGRGRYSVGSLVLSNPDGGIDFLYDTILDGREVRFYMGDFEWPRSDFRLIGKATVLNVTGSETQLTLALRDKSLLLDATMIGETITSGPNTGKPKPLLFGDVKNLNLTPYLLDATALTYAINSYALSGASVVDDVRDGGLTLDDGQIWTSGTNTLTANAGTDTLNLSTAHTFTANDVLIFNEATGTPITLPSPLAVGTQYWVISAGLTANDFRLSLTKGGSAINLTTTTVSGNWGITRRRYYVDMTAATIELSGSPAGQITADVVALAPSFPFATPHSAFKYILANYTSLSASDYDSTAIDALESSQRGSLVWGRAVLDRVNVLDILDEIALISLSWYAWGADGVLTVGQLDLANLDAATPTETITEDDIEGDLTAENLALQWGMISLDGDRNASVQTDGLLDAVSAADKSKWGQPFQTRVTTTDPPGTDYAGSWFVYHYSAIDSKPIASSIAQGGAGMQFWVDAMTELFRPYTRVHRATVGLDKYAIEPGDCVLLTHPRFGLDEGKNCRVVSVRPRVTDKSCDVVLVRQARPDYSVGSYS